MDYENIFLNLLSHSIFVVSFLLKPSKDKVKMYWHGAEFFTDCLLTTAATPVICLPNTKHLPFTAPLILHEFHTTMPLTLLFHLLETPFPGEVLSILQGSIFPFCSLPPCSLHTSSLLSVLLTSWQHLYCRILAVQFYVSWITVYILLLCCLSS